MATTYEPMKERPPVSEADRLGFTIFLALCFHLIIILGIGFAPEDDPKTDYGTLNVVLAHNPSEDRPDKADFIGQANQLAGGKNKQVQTATTPIQAPFPAQQIAPTSAQEIKKVDSTQTQQQLLNSLNANIKTQLSAPTPEDEKQGQKTPGFKLSTRAMAIASLQAELDKARKAEGNNPRRRTVSTAIHQSSEALYLDSWQRKIEKIGNLNYPAKARTLKIYGTLLVKVSINQDGSLESVSILKSSGKKILDDAAIRIVRLAAPFNPLPPEIRKTTDILTIIRKWTFPSDNKFSTQ
ncbi:MAG TPA: energy transducer TonB [Aeromonadales bacterium]|nr:energy transducer TonB [Aeromonadales bacterium]